MTDVPAPQPKAPAAIQEQRPGIAGRCSMSRLCVSQPRTLAFVLSALSDAVLSILAQLYSVVRLDSQTRDQQPITIGHSPAANR